MIICLRGHVDHFIVSNCLSVFISSLAPLRGFSFNFSSCNKPIQSSRQGKQHYFGYWPMYPAAAFDISEPNLVSVIMSGPNYLNLQLHPFSSFAIRQLVF